MSGVGAGTWTPSLVRKAAVSGKCKPNYPWVKPTPTVRGPLGIRSASVRGLFGVRSGSVRDPFEGHAGSVRDPKPAPAKKTPQPGGVLKGGR